MGILFFINKYNVKYLDFVHKPPKSSFKKLFVETNLSKALVKMSKDKALPNLEERKIKTSSSSSVSVSVSVSVLVLVSVSGVGVYRK